MLILISGAPKEMFFASIGFREWVGIIVSEVTDEDLFRFKVGRAGGLVEGCKGGFCASFLIAVDLISID